MKILITGIAGRIGANLAKTFLDQGHSVRGLVWTHDRRPEKLADLPIELMEGTITAMTDVERSVAGVDVICHLAAAFQGGGPFTNEQYFEINVRGTFNMLEAARQHAPNLQHFFYASSDAIYEKYIPGGIAEPIREDNMKIAPGGQYALTKYLGEELALGYHRNFGLPVTVFRFALVVAGEEILNFPQFYRHHWRKAYAIREGDLAAGVRAELDRLAPSAIDATDRCLLIARDEQGRSYKKHIADVRDIVQGFTDALNKPVAGEIYQLAAPQPYTWQEAIPYLADKLGAPYIDISLAGNTPTFYEFDITKGRRHFGYTPQWDIFRMIDDAVAMRDGSGGGVIPTW
ncbi:MAG TPA: NAD(P)-dependent oxidoreductase [Caldilineaceae bacterium]|nr:NAD(P)-dependent oxidoreductase [Caldilineaceae bacterium]